MLFRPLARPAQAISSSAGSAHCANYARALVLSTKVTHRSVQMSPAQHPQAEVKDVEHARLVNQTEQPA